MAEGFEIAAFSALVAPAEELDESFDVGADAVEGVEFSHGAGERLGTVEEFSAGLFEFGDIRVGKAGALEADGIEPANAIGAIHDHEGGHVVVNAGRAADVGVIADGDEMVNARAAHEVDAISTDDMTGDHDIVGHDAVVADLGVVADVAVGHEKVVVSDAGAAAAFNGADVGGEALAEDVVVADFKACGLAGVFFVLRRAAEGDVMMDDVARADLRVPDDDDVAQKPAPGADDHVGADLAKGADDDVVGDAGLRIDAR